MIKGIYRSVRNEYDRKICREGWGGGACFLRGERVKNIYIYILYTKRWIDTIYGNPFSFNKNHLSCRARIIGYIWVTLNLVKSKTLSLDMILMISWPGVSLHYSIFSL